MCTLVGAHPSNTGMYAMYMYQLPTRLAMYRSMHTNAQQQKPVALPFQGCLEVVGMNTVYF